MDHWIMDSGEIQAQGEKHVWLQREMRWHLKKGERERSWNSGAGTDWQERRERTGIAERTERENWNSGAERSSRAVQVHCPQDSIAEHIRVECVKAGGDASGISKWGRLGQ